MDIYVNNLMIKIKLLYEIRTRLEEEATITISRLTEILDKSLLLPFTCSELRVFNGANHYEQNSRVMAKGT